MKAQKIKLTYGYELEGIFSREFAAQFVERGEFKDDGSVSVRIPQNFEPFYFDGGNGRCEDSCGECYGDRGTHAECECDYNCELDEHWHDSDCEDKEGDITCGIEAHEHDYNCLPCDGDEGDDIHWVDCEACDGTGECQCDDDGGDLAREFASNVYSDIDKTVADIEKFTEKNGYVRNESCGFHFHIGSNTQEGMNKLRGVLCNYKFIQSLQKMATKKMCDCQKARLANSSENHWCKPYTSANGIIRELRYSGKYLFMNFHPSGTLEFRFLSSCEHKVDNLKMFLSEVHAYLEGNESMEVAAVEPPARKRISANHKIDIKIDVKKIVEQPAREAVVYEQRGDRMVGALWGGMEWSGDNIIVPAGERYQERFMNSFINNNYREIDIVFDNQLGDCYVFAPRMARRRIEPRIDDWQYVEAIDWTRSASAAMERELNNSFMASSN